MLSAGAPQINSQLLIFIQQVCSHPFISENLLQATLFDSFEDNNHHSQVYMLHCNTVTTFEEISKYSNNKNMWKIECPVHITSHSTVCCEDDVCQRWIFLTASDSDLWIVYRICAVNAARRRCVYEWTEFGLRCVIMFSTILCDADAKWCDVWIASIEHCRFVCASFLFSKHQRWYSCIQTSTHSHASQCLQ